MENFNTSPIDSIKKTLEEFKIFNTDDSSIINIFVESIDEQLTLLQQSINDVQGSIHISSAQGKSLDDHFEPFGISRIQTSNPVFSMKIEMKSDKAVSELTTDGNGFIIPAGSALAIGSDGTNMLLAECMNDIYFGPNDKTVYISFLMDASIIQDKILAANSFTAFQSDVKGAIDNINPTMLDEFEITCTNDTNITINSEGEDDQALKMRGINTLRSSTERMQLAVETALSVIPGIVNIDFIKNKIGVGTVSIILTVSNQSELESIYIAAKDILNDISDDSMMLTLPTFIDVEVHNKLVIKESATEEQITTMRNDIVADQMKLINQTIAGQDLQISQLKSISEANGIIESAEITCIKLDGVPIDNVTDIVTAWDEQLITTVIDGITPIKFIQ